MAPLDSTMGATYIGVVLAAVLYGVSCVQAWLYYSSYPNDNIGLKFLVAAVWISDSIHQALITNTVYTYVITNYGNEAELGNVVWSLVVEVLFNGITALLVQSFFAWRVWKFSNKNPIVSCLIMLLVTSEFVCVVVYTVQALRLTTFAELIVLKNLSMTVNALAAAGDVLIAAALVFLLHRSRTGFRRSDSMISKLMVFAVNTGLLTSLCAVLSLVSISALPNTFIYICFYFMMGRLYANSLLAILNARKSIRGNDSGDLATSMGDVSVSLKGMRRTTAMVTSDPTQTTGGLAIKIDTIEEGFRDQDSCGDLPYTGDMAYKASAI